MAWLGSTIKSLDTRKELVSYIGGNTQPSRAVVTNSGGEIDSSVVTLAELALLSGVSSNVQTQLTDLGNDKQDEITGAATTVTSANLTSNRVLLSDASGKIIASTVTATTLAYLDPTSSIQGQLDGKHPEITASAPLSQSSVDGLANTLSGKQPIIGSTTNLVVNKITFGSGVGAIDFQGTVNSSKIDVGVFTINSGQSITGDIGTIHYLTFDNTTNANGIDHTSSTSDKIGSFFRCNESGIFTINVGVGCSIENTGGTPRIQLALRVIYYDGSLTNPTSRPTAERQYRMGTVYMRGQTNTNVTELGGTVTLSLENAHSFEIAIVTVGATYTDKTTTFSGSLTIDKVGL